MIELQNIREKVLSQLGIAFDDPDDASLFADFVRNELYVRTDEMINAHLTASELVEYYEIAGGEQAESWIHSHIPRYEKLLREVELHLAWDILTSRSSISTTSFYHDIVPNDKTIDDLDLSRRAYRYLIECYSRHHFPKTPSIKEIVDSDILSHIRKMQPLLEQEIISKTLDYLLSDSANDTIMELEDSDFHVLMDDFQLDEE